MGLVVGTDAVVGAIYARILSCQLCAYSTRTQPVVAARAPCLSTSSRTQPAFGQHRKTAHEHTAQQAALARLLLCMALSHD